ncbi:MAG: methyltransferase [Bacteroidetes bacterium]|nr:methyltransferase [Bacteroidota bacterium]
MPESTFNFKQFIINQDKSAMKVSTDSVLLGAWAKADNTVQRVLDIGSGTGILSLMLAQKTDAEITALEIDIPSYLQSLENFAISKWKDRLHAINKSLQEFALSTSQTFDIIISNPPFFADASPAPDEARNIARHLDETLSLADLANGVKKLLAPNGKFYVIFPYREAIKFYETALRKDLFCNCVTRIKTRPQKLEKRILMQFSHILTPINESQLTLASADNVMTEDYKQLTIDYYLDSPDSANV